MLYDDDTFLYVLDKSVTPSWSTMMFSVFLLISVVAKKVEFIVACWKIYCKYISIEQECIWDVSFDV